ncbi:hypothetical protein EVAR_38855_1 [Eumeta japonica]|uniref:Uncharacterized protein n=1 Tax=Eumeta variegata TaxID=151549 RepID=A0A4C1X4F5_EUMVA|nr:hypothetical protein EVAR_38855_1 [Eumeta japonica]
MSPPARLEPRRYRDVIEGKGDALKSNVLVIYLMATLRAYLGEGTRTPCNLYPRQRARVKYFRAYMSSSSAGWRDGGRAALRSWLRLGNVTQSMRAALRHSWSS